MNWKVSDGQSVYHKSGGGQQPTLVLLGHYLSTVTSALERAAEEKSSLLSKIQDINELSRQEVDGIINTFTEKTLASSSDNTSTRRYIAMVEMCQIVGDRDQLNKVGQSLKVFCRMVSWGWYNLFTMYYMYS
ncbi:hypothetical protein RDABS01_019330 [Bienertia sinuspersici]